MSSNRKFFSFDTILFLILLGILFVVLKNHFDRKPPQNIKKVSQFKVQGQFVQNQQAASRSTIWKRSRSKDKQADKQKSYTAPPPRAAKAESESKKVLDKFRRIAKLQFKAPPDFTFKEVDADDYLIIKGANHSGNHLTMMAGRVYGSEQQIKPFIYEHLELFGGRLTAAHIGKLQKIQEYKNFNNSGDVTIMQSEVNGHAVFVGVMRRNDKQGSYMFVLEGDSNLKNNTDRFEDVFEDLRAL